MPRPRMHPRLALRRRPDGQAEWVIRDQQIYRRTGLLEEDRDQATMMLRAYAARVYGKEVAATIGPPIGVAPKRHMDKSIVYFIGDGASVKIGIAGNLRSRLRDIQAHCPQELHLYGTISGGLAVERKLHKRFAAHHIRREWFRMEGALLDYLCTLPDLARMEGFPRLSEPRHSSSKLTASQVRLIQQNPAGLSGRELARLFEIGEATISEVRTGKGWKKVA